MKGFVILVIVLIIGFIIYAAGRKQEIEKQNSAKKPPVVQKTEKPSTSAKPSAPAKPSTSAKPSAPAKPSTTTKTSNSDKPANTGGIGQEITDTINYGTGYTQVKAGNNAKNKIQNIQQQQNQRHQKALEE